MDLGNKICLGSAVLFVVAFIWGMISEWKKDEIEKRKRKFSRRVPRLLKNHIIGLTKKPIKR
jgi:hypothetical protein